MAKKHLQMLKALIRSEIHHSHLYQLMLIIYLKYR